MEVLKEEQEVSVMRVLEGSFGFQERPTNTARVKMELTWMIPSSAVMWIEVPKGLS